MNYDLKKTALDLLQMLSERTYQALEDFYHPEVEQIEFPNTLTRTKTIRNLNDLKEGLERGKKVLSKEEYKVTNAIEICESVILEVEWKGTLAIPFGKIPIGGQMQANLAVFFEFKSGKIFRQRNYDCFEPFG